MSRAVRPPDETYARALWRDDATFDDVRTHILGRTARDIALLGRRFRHARDTINTAPPPPTRQRPSYHHHILHIPRPQHTLVRHRRTLPRPKRNHRHPHPPLTPPTTLPRNAPLRNTPLRSPRIRQDTRRQGTRHGVQSALPLDQGTGAAGELRRGERGERQGGVPGGEGGGDGSGQG